MEIVAGLQGEVRARVEGSLVTARTPEIRVLSTPSLIWLLEQAAQRALDGHLPEGGITVGARVDVQHLAATPEGHEVVARATLTQVDGRRLVFAVEAHDPFELVARGTHERYVLDAERYRQRLERKSIHTGR